MTTTHWLKNERFKEIVIFKKENESCIEQS